MEKDLRFFFFSDDIAESNGVFTSFSIALGEIGFSVCYLDAFSAIATNKMSLHMCRKREWILFCHIPDLALKESKKTQHLFVESHFLVIL